MTLVHDQKLSETNYATRETTSNNLYLERNWSKIVFLCGVLVIMSCSIDNNNNQHEETHGVSQSWLNDKLLTNNIQK